MEDDRPVRAQPLQVIRDRWDLRRIAFTDGMAAVEVPFHLLRHITFRNDERSESPRLETLKASIRRNGYVPFDPIIASITKSGKWSVVDGGHRLTAARAVAKEFWTNLFRRKVERLYFLLFTTPRSLTKVKGKAKRPDTLSPSDPPAALGPADFRDEDEDTRL